MSKTVDCEVFFTMIGRKTLVLKAVLCGFLHTRSVARNGARKVVIIN
jgi:hypothetical protein